MQRSHIMLCALLASSPLSATAQAATSVLQARASRCLDVTDGKFTNGTRPQLWDCNASSKNQQWQLDNGQLKTSGNKCLDVTDGNKRNGANVQLWDCAQNNANQRWESAGASLKVQGTNLCLDVKDGRFQNGGQLQLWTCDERPNGNQVWAFVAGNNDVAQSAPPKNAPAGAVASDQESSFYGYRAISVDAFIRLHPECAGFKDPVMAAALDQGINAVFLLAIAETESSCRAAPSNGWGAFQFSDEGAWRAFGGADKDRQNVWDAAFAAARFFKHLLGENDNNIDKAMRAYNGPIANGGNPNYQKEVATWMSGGNPWG